MIEGRHAPALYFFWRRSVGARFVFGAGTIDEGWPVSRISVMRRLSFGLVFSAIVAASTVPAPASQSGAAELWRQVEVIRTANEIEVHGRHLRTPGLSGPAAPSPRTRVILIRYVPHQSSRGSA